MRLSFDTIGVVPSDRAGFWREVVCAVYVPMDTEPLVRNAFHARMEARTFLGRTWSGVGAGPQRVARDARQIAAANSRDIFTFVVQGEGSCAVEQAGRRALLIPGGHALVFDNSRPYRLVLRTLQRAFEAEGASLMRWLRGERLERCAALLVDAGHRGHSITQIAVSLGFRDIPAFCRSFKRRFGESPSGWRATRVGGDER